MQRVKYDNSFKSYVISLYQAGKSQSDISKSLKINKSMVSRWIHKFNTTGNVTTLRSGGPPRKLSYRDDIQIKKLIKKNPFISSKEILKTLNLNVDSSTIRRHAIKLGLKSYKACSKPMLTKKHMKKRLEFAKKYIDWSVEKWNTVLFSDEVKVNLFNSDGMCTVRHQKGNRLNPRYCKQTVKHGGGNVMVWTCFSGNRLGPVHQIVDKMDRFMYRDILETKMLPYAGWHMPLRWVFQQDNDPKHTSKLVKDWFNANRIQVLDWPAQSPDLNPIENLFAIVKQRMGSYRYTNKKALFKGFKKEWKSIPKVILRNLIASMPKRCAAVIKNAGSYTKY